MALALWSIRQRQEGRARAADTERLDISLLGLGVLLVVAGVLRLIIR